VLLRSFQFSQRAFQIPLVIRFGIVAISAVHAKVIAQKRMCKDNVVALAVASVNPARR
jgi:hypothetical protein